MYIFAFVVCAFGFISKKSLPSPMSTNFLFFFFKRLIASGFSFKSLIHFDFCMWSKERVHCNFYMWISNLPNHVLKRISFLHCVFLEHLLKINGLHMCGFISGLCILFLWSMSVFIPVTYMKLKDAYSLEGKLWPT